MIFLNLLFSINSIYEQFFFNDRANKTAPKNLAKLTQVLFGIAIFWQIG